MVNVSLAMDLLEQALPGLGAESPEGQTVLACLKQMSGHFKHELGKAKDLVPQEIMQLQQSLPQHMKQGMKPGMPPQGGQMPPQAAPQM